LRKLKKQYDKVVAVVPYVAASLITYADELLCVSTDFLKKANAHYPYILDQNVRDVPGWVDSGFMKMAIDYANEHYPGCEFHLFHDGPYPCETMLGAIPEGCKIVSQNTEPEYEKDMWKQFFIEFATIGASIKERVFAYPFKEDKENIEKYYGHMFEGKKTYITLTRNFSWKATMHNTRADLIPYLEEILKNGYSVVNIGFPCFPTGIQNENYHEISQELTYSELLCLTHMSKGILMQGCSGSFSNHLRTTIPVMLTNKMHSVYQSIWNDRCSMKELYSKKTPMWEDGPISMPDFINIINECSNVEFEKKYISNNKCILLDKEALYENR
jgi:hypothetical protein